MKKQAQRTLEAVVCTTARIRSSCRGAKTAGRLLEQQIQQLQEDLDLAETRNEDLTNTEGLATRHVKAETELLKQLRTNGQRRYKESRRNK